MSVSRCIGRCLAIGGLWFVIGHLRGEILDPYSATSPSGAFSVHVDPASPDGEDGAHYRLERDGQTVWEGERSFALRKVIVTDDGIVGGYAHFDERPQKRGDDARRFLVIVLIGADGEVRLEERIERVRANVHTNPPSDVHEPKGSGVFLIESERRLIVESRSRWAALDAKSSGVSWHVYDVGAAALHAMNEPFAPDIDCADGKWLNLYDSTSIPGTPLLLTEWRGGCREDGVNAEKVAFGVHKSDGVLLWSLQSTNQEAKEARAARFRLDRRGERQIAAKEGQFSVTSWGNLWTKTIAVRADPAAIGEWRFEEVQQVPFVLPDAPPALPVMELGEIALEPRGTIELEPAIIEGGSIEGIVSFAIGRDGSMAALRRFEDPGTHKSRWFVLLFAPGGEFKGDVSIVPLEGGHFYPTRVLPQPNGEWIVVDEARFSDSPGRWLRLDAEAKPVGVVELEVKNIDDAAALSDGSVAVTPARMRDQSIYLLDADGRVLWQRELERAPKHLAVTGADQIAVVDYGEAAIRVWSSDGTEQKPVGLKEALGRKPNLVYGLHGDAGNQVIIETLGPGSRFSRVRTTGELALGFDPDPSLPQMNPGPGVVGSPDGSLWTTDGNALLILDQQGKISRRIGRPRQERGISRLSAVSLSRDDTFYGVDSETGAVHLFDQAGKHLRSLAGAPSGAGTERQSDARISVDGSGAACLPQRGQDFRLGMWRVPLDGEPSLLRPTIADPSRVEIATAIIPKPSSDEVWSTMMESELRLSAADGSVIKRVRRRSDDRWLKSGQNLAVAFDGSVAVAEPDGFATFAPDGTPRIVVPAPTDASAFMKMAFNGRFIAATVSGQLLISPVDGTQTRRMPLPDANPYKRWDVLMSRDGAEVLVRQEESLTIHRFALPK